MKDILLIIIIVFVTFALFFTWCCMKISGEADRRDYERTNKIHRKR